MKIYNEILEGGHHIFEYSSSQVKIWDEEIYSGEGKSFSL